MQDQKTQPLLTPILRWFMLAMVLANTAGAMYTMLLPIHLAQLGASLSQVGLVFPITSVAILALQVIGGWISDSIGRLRAIAIGYQREKDPEWQGANPSDLLPLSAASCSAYDVVAILEKQKQPLQGLSVTVTGTQKKDPPPNTCPCISPIMSKGMSNPRN